VLVSSEDVIAARNVLLLPVQLTLSQSIGACGCMTSLMRYRVIVGGPDAPLSDWDLVVDLSENAALSAGTSTCSSSAKRSSSGRHQCCALRNAKDRLRTERRDLPAVASAVVFCEAPAQAQARLHVYC
jgi:hypothetical protein